MVHRVSLTVRVSAIDGEGWPITKLATGLKPKNAAAISPADHQYNRHVSHRPFMDLRLSPLGMPKHWCSLIPGPDRVDADATAGVFGAAILVARSHVLEA